MSNVQQFNRADQDFSFEEGQNAKVMALVNVGNSDQLGGGIGTFGAGCDMEWTVTYDEILFIHEGNFMLQVGDVVYHAGPGDTLWIPANTPLRYQTGDEAVTFFYAVHPVNLSPSTMHEQSFATAEPKPA